MWFSFGKSNMHLSFIFILYFCGGRKLMFLTIIQDWLSKTDEY
jgi:hypothetical protein